MVKVTKKRVSRRPSRPVTNEDLYREMTKMGSQIDALTAVVGDLTVVVKAAVELLGVLAAGQGDDSALGPLVDQIKTAVSELGDAVAANTPK